jgi:hypothetical protein
VPIIEVERLDKTSIDEQVKAAMSACIAQEMRNGRTRDQAIEICYSMMRAKIGKELGKPQPEPQV